MTRRPSPTEAALTFVCWAFVASVVGAIILVHAAEALGLINHQLRHPVNDAIVSCLQREGMPIYGVGPAGVPSKGQPFTGDHVVVVCVEEKR